MTNDQRAQFYDDAFSLSIHSGDGDSVPLTAERFYFDNDDEAKAVRDALCERFGVPGATPGSDRRLILRKLGRVLSVERGSILCAVVEDENGEEVRLEETADRAPDALREAEQRAERDEAQVARLQGVVYRQYSGREQIVFRSNTSSYGVPEFFDIEDPDLGQTRYFSVLHVDALERRIKDADARLSAVSKALGGEADA